MKYLEPFYFLVALAVGLFFTYVFTPLPELVFKHPTPDNSDKVIYKDDTDMCYKYYVQEVDCPKSGIEDIPIQHNKYKSS